jgi:hypothetical protein
VLRPRWLWWVVGWGLDRPSLRWISGLWNFSSSSPSFGISVRRSGCRGGRAAGLGPCLIRLVGRRIYPWAFGASGVHGGGRARQRRRASLLLRRRGGPLGMVTTGLNALPGASFLLWGSDGGPISAPSTSLSLRPSPAAMTGMEGLSLTMRWLWIVVASGGVLGRGLAVPWWHGCLWPSGRALAVPWWRSWLPRAVVLLWRSVGGAVVALPMTVCMIVCQRYLGGAIGDSHVGIPVAPWWWGWWCQPSCCLRWRCGRKLIPWTTSMAPWCHALAEGDVEHLLCEPCIPGVVVSSSFFGLVLRLCLLL